MINKIWIISFFVAVVGARHAVPLPELPLLSDTAFAATQDNGQPCPPECITDSMEIVTWYPSPYNEYEELRLYPTQRDDNYCDNDKIGLMYYDDGGTSSFPEDDKMRVCKGVSLGWQEVGGGGPWQASGNSIYNTNPGNVGIGKNNPYAKLDVEGDIRVGNSYAGCGSNTAGSVRYNAITGRVELCNGSSWYRLSIAEAVPASVVCGAWNANYTLTSPYVSTYFSSPNDCKKWCEQSPGQSKTTACSWAGYNNGCHSGYGGSVIYLDTSNGPKPQAASCS